MPFVDLSQIPAIEPVPGCRMRTPHGQNIMLSYLEMEDGAEVPLHHHPHEQAGMLIKGQVQLTIGDETRICEAGSMFIIPPNVPHRAVAVNGPCRGAGCFQSRARRLRRTCQPLHSSRQSPRLRLLLPARLNKILPVSTSMNRVIVRPEKLDLDSPAAEITGWLLSTTVSGAIT